MSEARLNSKKKRVFSIELFDDLSARVRLALQAELSRRKLLALVGVAVVTLAGSNLPKIIEWFSTIAPFF